MSWKTDLFRLHDCHSVAFLGRAFEDVDEDEDEDVAQDEDEREVWQR